MYPHDESIGRVTQGGAQQSLSEHLTGVAALAARFGSPCSCSDWARLAGLWHDLGKYSEEFQRYIRLPSGLPPENVAGPARVDHSTFGAQIACAQSRQLGRILAYVIAGHHTGLPDWQSESAGPAALAQRLVKRVPAAEPPSELLAIGLPAERPRPGTDASMWIRMLFSCVVDADRLDSEAFSEPANVSLRQSYPPLEQLAPLFDAYMMQKLAEAKRTSVNAARARVLDQCLAKAETAPAVFTLTVPTGGGKTLASMAFALKHALKYGKQRIIYVIPYTSIIEQTADQFREIFGSAVLEHHSNVEPPETEGDEQSLGHLACENWDAPIVVTTTVQFFESLYAAHPGRCRKLHNIANSVVVLDEAQLLPPGLLNPILKAVLELHKNYGVTLLLSTATQPAFTPTHTPDYRFDGLPNTTEIVDDPEALHRALKRVKVRVPRDMSQRIPWESLAAELEKHPTVLCVVNRRDDCRTLHALMPEGTIHLSALMCGAHRSGVIKTIKKRIDEHVPTRVISTQLVEAGVDLDFPVVYRALAGLDSIAQAAGRCNREGELSEPGDVVVFVPESDPPRGLLRMAAGIGRRLLADRSAEPLAPERFTAYFRELYWLHGERLDEHGILRMLAPDAEMRFSFRSAAGEFHIIDASQYVPVFVRYAGSSNLLSRLGAAGPERWLMRNLQRYVVNVPRYLLDGLLASGEVAEQFPGLHVQTTLGRYDDAIGLVCDRQQLSPDDLIV